MTEWRKTTLGTVCQEGGGFIRTGPFGTQLHQSDYVDDPNGIPVVMPKDMSEGRIDLTSIARIDQPTAERLADHLLTAGDIVLSRRGDVGRSVWVGEEDLPVLCGTGSMRIHPGDDGPLAVQFLRYVMRSKPTVNYLEGHAVGATMANLNAGIVSELPLTVPPMDQQMMVGEILSSLDSLIENYQRRTELLNQMAQAVYREWFVNFRYPGHEQGTLVDSSLGLIPEGWVAAPPNSIGEITVGGDWGSDKPGGEDWIEVTCLRGVDLQRLRSGNPEGVKMRWVKKQSLEKRRVEPHDVVVEGSGECGRALAGSERLALLLGRPVIYSNFCKRIRFDSAAMAMYVARWLNEMVADGSMQIYKTGTAIPNLNFKALVQSCLMVIPPQPLLERYRDICRPMEEFAYLGPSRSLRVIRDLLIPRLVSGQIDVSSLDLDAVVEYVA